MNSIAVIKQQGSTWHILDIFKQLSCDLVSICFGVFHVSTCCIITRHGGREARMCNASARCGEGRIQTASARFLQICFASFRAALHNVSHRHDFIVGRFDKLFALTGNRIQIHIFAMRKFRCRSSQNIPI